MREIRPKRADECDKHLLVRPELQEAIKAAAVERNAKLYVVTDEVVRAGLAAKGIPVAAVTHS